MCMKRRIREAEEPISEKRNTGSDRGGKLFCHFFQQRKTKVFAKIRYNRRAASAIMEWIVMTAGAAGMTAHA